MSLAVNASASFAGHVTQYNTVLTKRQKAMDF